MAPNGSVEKKLAGPASYFLLITMESVAPTGTAARCFPFSCAFVVPPTQTLNVVNDELRNGNGSRVNPMRHSSVHTTGWRVEGGECESTRMSLRAACPEKKVWKKRVHKWRHCAIGLQAPDTFSGAQRGEAGIRSVAAQRSLPLRATPAVDPRGLNGAS